MSGRHVFPWPRTVARTRIVISITRPAAWASVPDVARGWDALDPFEREMSRLEWSGVAESRLRERERRRKRTTSSPAHQSRHEEPVRLVARVRPTLDALFADLS